MINLKEQSFSSAFTSFSSSSSKSSSSISSSKPTFLGRVDFADLAFSGGAKNPLIVCACVISCFDFRIDTVAVSFSVSNAGSYSYSNDYIFVI